MSAGIDRLRALEQEAMRSSRELPASLAAIGRETEEGHEYIAALCQAASILFRVAEAARSLADRYALPFDMATGDLRAALAELDSVPLVEEVGE